MSGIARVLKFLFDPAGRTRRRDYFWFLLIGIFLPSVLQTLDSMLASILSGGRSDLHVIFGFDLDFLYWFMLLNLPSMGPVQALGSVGWVICAAVISIRRLHDIGRPWSWLATYTILSAIVMFGVFWSLQNGTMQFDGPGAAIRLVLAIALAGPQLALALMPGVSGTNRFGLDPRGAAPPQMNKPELGIPPQPPVTQFRK